MCRFGALLLIGALLFSAGGCSEQHRGIADGHRFEVDGTAYWLDRHAEIDRHENAIDGFLVLRPYDALSAFSYREKSDSQGNRSWKIVFADGSEEAAQSFMLYYISERGIESMKSFRELGIDPIVLGREKNEQALAELGPVLETLIREHAAATPEKE